MSARTKNRRSRSFKITRHGAAFLLLIAIVTGVGIVKGLNLIYLAASMMVSFMLISQLLSRIGLSRLSSTRLLPQHVFAEKPFPVEIRVKNDKRRFSTYSINVRDVLENMDMPERYLIKVPAKTSVTATYEYRIDRRGLYQFKGTRISTLYPLDMFQRGFVEPDVENLIVYPRILKLNPNFVAEMMTEVELRLNRPGAGSEVYGFRKYQPGDSSRDINWKLSAKTSELTITKYSQDQNLHIVVVFDNSTGEMEPSGTPGEEDDTAERFESVVRFVASISSFFIEKGYKVKLVTQSGELGFGEGAKQLFQILRHLALIQPIPAGEVTKDIYHPGVLEQKLGILIVTETTSGATGHFMHTFHARRMAPI